MISICFYWEEMDWVYSVDSGVRKPVDDGSSLTRRQLLLAAIQSVQDSEIVLFWQYLFFSFDSLYFHVNNHVNQLCVYSLIWVIITQYFE